MLICILSCDSYIDIVPDDVATFDLVFNNRANAKKFFYTLYGYMPNQSSPTENVSLVTGDEVWPIAGFAGGWETFRIAQGEQSKASPLFNAWGGDAHIALRDCNIFLENIDKVIDMTNQEKERWKAEVKFIKAYFHFYLLKMYGPIPIIDENIDVSEDISGVRIERDKVDDVINYVVSLLEEALPDLPPIIVLENEELGRVTKPIAAMLKAKVLAFSASPLLNGNSVFASWTNDAGESYINQTFDANKWALAADACEEAITLAHEAGNGLFTFVTDFTLSDETLNKMNLRGAVTERWNKEIIWGQIVPTTANITNISFARIDPTFQGASLGQVNSYYSPPLRMAELFYSENGVPIEEDISYAYNDRYTLTVGDDDNKFYVQEGYETIELHLNRESRFYASLAGDGILSYDINNRADDTQLFVVDAKNGGLAGVINERQHSQTGYWPKKLVNFRSAIGNNSFFAEPYSWPIYRLADLYLLYAECLNEVQGPTPEVFQYVDVVRERSGLDGVETSWSSYSNNPTKPSTKSGLREIIHQERLIELAFEGHRFWDLRRWFKAHILLNGSQIRGWDFSKTSPSTFYNSRTYGVTEFSIKNYFWPISEEDILQNPNIDQAFGW